MNVSYREWNQLLQEGESLCDAIRRESCSVKMRPYTTSNGNKGIAFQLRDLHGDLFQEFTSGAGAADVIHTEMIRNANRILALCGVKTRFPHKEYQS